MCGLFKYELILQCLEYSIYTGSFRMKVKNCELIKFAGRLPVTFDMWQNSDVIGT